MVPISLKKADNFRKNVHVSFNTIPLTLRLLKYWEFQVLFARVRKSKQHHVEVLLKGFNPKTSDRELKAKAQAQEAFTHSQKRRFTRS